MSSWLIIVILSILLVVCISMLLLLYWDIRRITSQLKGINENFGTNELIRTNTHSRGLLRFIENINQLIHLFKQDQQRKQRREEALKQEITNLSHDLRTPLTSIKGFSELMADPLCRMQKKDFLAIIQKKIDHLTMMVDQFYELSQIESSDQKFSIQQVSLNQLVVDTMLLFYHDFEKNKLQIEIDETAVPPILANEKAVHRIISNIVQNALRYAESYFTIRLAEEEECVKLEAENDITVLDDKTELHRIFDRSYRMDSSRAGGQLGLGLHIVRQLVMKLGGQIDAKLEDNKFQLVVLFKKWS